MHISEIIGGDEPEDETEHFKALADTGFYGREAAGCIFLAKSHGLIGIAHRAMYGVEQPNTWGSVGGAINPGDDPKTAAIREAAEEVGYRPRRGDDLLPLDLFQSGRFRYTTFLYLVETIFQAQLNWENQGFDWFEMGRWPQPLHFGLQATFAKPACLNTIKTEIDKWSLNQHPV